MKKLQIEIHEEIYYLDKSFIFSGGEVQIRLPTLPDVDVGVLIYVRTMLNSSDKIMELALTKSTLNQRYPDNDFILISDYFPYARQDRACVEGEAFSLKVICDIINAMEFKNVLVSDAHSKITLDLLDNVSELKQFKLVCLLIEKFAIDIKSKVLVSPDKGALTKIKELTSLIDMIPVHAYKVRDPDTGDIIETRIDVDDFKGKDIFIIDDLCDGGRTFIELAKVLKTKNVGTISLYTTHGIFSKGLDVIFEHIDEVYTTDSFYDGSDDRVKVLNVYEGAYDE